MTGPEAPFEGRHGLWEQITDSFELEPFGVDGGDWTFPLIRLKYWPVEYNAQAGVWAALQLREKVAHADIARIDMATYWSAWHEIGSEPEKWNPTTRETADHSLPFIVARELVDGTITVKSFDKAAIPDRFTAADGKNHRARGSGDRGAVSGADCLRLGRWPWPASATKSRSLASCPVDNLTNCKDLPQDFISCGSPDEWMSVAVVVCDECVDPVDELSGTRDEPAPDFLLRQGYRTQLST